MRSGLHIKKLVNLKTRNISYFKQLDANHDGEITMAETVALFKTADIVVGAFGGTLANIVFCAPRTQVVEIALREPAYRTYMHLAAAMGLGYWVTTDTPDNSFTDALVAPVEKVRDIVEHVVATLVG